MKSRDRLRGFVDYHARNMITKRKNAPITRTDEMFDRMEEANVFSKIILKKCFHQIRMKSGDIGKMAFN